MKRFLYSLCAACLAFSQANGETFNGPTKLYLKIVDELLINGPADLELVKTQSLTVHGTLKFSRLRVQDAVDVTGPVQGHKGEFGSLKVLGPVDVNYVRIGNLQVSGPVSAANIEVEHNAEIFGALDVQNGRFGNITVTASRIILDNVTVHNIVVKPTKEAEQLLILKGNSEVNGTILFESGNGVVEQEEQVKIHDSISGTKVSKPEE